MRTSRLQLLVWAFALAAVAWPTLALAEPRAVVQDFKGDRSAKKARSAVVGVLEDHDVVLVPPKKVKRLARKSGAELDSESGRVRVASRLGLTAFIEGTARTVKRRVEIDIRVYRGSDGMEAAAYKTTVRKWSISRELNKQLWDAIGAAIEGAEGAREPSGPEATPRTREPEVAAAPRQREPERSELSEELDDELPPGIARSPAVEQSAYDEGSEALALETQVEQGGSDDNFPAAFDLAVGARIGTRSFGYNDSLPGLRGYSLLPSPSLALHGHWYPAAHFSSSAAAHIGLDVRADVLVGVSSENDDGEKFSTSSHRFGFGLRGRIPLNKLELGVIAGYGQHAFSVADSGTVDPDVPDINYSFVRLGADARYQFVPFFAVQLQAAFLAGLSLGEISSAAWFPHATGNGIELEAGIQLSLSRLLAFELAFGMQRYFMSLNPEESDPGVRIPRVAGGALDKYVSGRLGLIIRP